MTPTHRTLRRGADEVDRRGRRHVGVRRQNHLVTRADAKRPKPDEHAVRAVRHAYRRPSMDEPSHGVLKVLEIALQDVRPTLHDVHQRLEYVIALLVEEVGVAEEGNLRNSRGLRHPGSNALSAQRVLWRPRDARPAPAMQKASRS